MFNVGQKVLVWRDSRSAAVARIDDVRNGVAYVRNLRGSYCLFDTVSGKELSNVPDAWRLRITPATSR